MSCKDCLQNCAEIISDQCVEYTGPSLGAPFNVCEGDQLSIFEANIVAVIQSLLSGTNVVPIDITQCTWFQQLFGTQAITANNILQTLVTGECNLNAAIVALQAQIGSNQNGVVIDTACLTGLPNNPTTSQILQAVITLLCTINTTVTAIPATYVKLSDLTTLVTPIVNSVINGGSTVQYSTRLVPFTAMSYFGPLSNFDNSGVGIPSLGFNRIFICNGQNGTPDMRGRVPVGAIRSIPGPALDPQVDPAVDPNNPNWAQGDRSGTNTVTLSVPQMPSHNHPLNDPGHSHTGSVFVDLNKSGGSNPDLALRDLGTGNSTFTTGSSVTGVTIGQTGGNQPHPNIQPSISGVWIMYIP